MLKGARHTISSGRMFLCLTVKVGNAMKYIFLALGIIIGYEIVRALILGSLRKRFTASVKEFIEKNRIRLDEYKFMHKLVVRHELLNDPLIHEAVIAHAGEKGLTIQEVQDRVEEYIDEIVPAFNLLSYYKLGYFVANLILNLVYEVVIDRENAGKLQRIPPGSVIVFVMNHRSNIDYILVAYMLARQISLSYAVGEWARVWPLEYIFKSFGAYFIRRRFRERLYHLVLEKYVQLISLQGVTQGVFLEGGLSRDGNLRTAKVGILDYIIGVKINPRFTGELVFVPAAINYDWVLEDRNLVLEWKAGKEKSGLRDNLVSLARVIGKTPFLFVANTIRYCAGRLKHHGYASVSFGEPVALSDFLKDQETDIFALERYDRLARVQELADMLLARIGSAMPVTPVSLVSLAILKCGAERIGLDELFVETGKLRHLIQAAGGRIVRGKEFEPGMAVHAHLAEEEEDRTRDLVLFEEDFLASEEARETVRTALEILTRRRIVSARKGMVVINRQKAAFLEFYANSLGHLTR